MFSTTAEKLPFDRSAVMGLVAPRASSLINEAEQFPDATAGCVDRETPALQ